jgi:hypothetical protein
MLERNSLKELESLRSRVAASRTLMSSRVRRLVFMNEKDTWTRLAYALSTRLLLEVVDVRLFGKPQAANMLESIPTDLMLTTPSFSAFTQARARHIWLKDFRNIPLGFFYSQEPEILSCHNCLSSLGLFWVSVS